MKECDKSRQSLVSERHGLKWQWTPMFSFILTGDFDSFNVGSDIIYEINHQLEKKRILPIKWMLLFYLSFQLNPIQTELLVLRKPDSGYLLSQLWPPLPFPSPQHAGAMGMRHYAIPTRASASAPPRASRGMNVSCKYHTSGTPGTIHTSPGSVKGLWNYLTPRATLFPGPCFHELWRILKLIDLKFSPFCFR